MFFVLFVVKYAEPEAGLIRPQGAVSPRRGDDHEVFTRVLADRRRTLRLQAVVFSLTITHKKYDFQIMLRGLLESSPQVGDGQAV